MSSFFSTLEELFGSKDLYEVLSTPRSSSEAEIKRAYYKLSLKVHPDRAQAEDRDIATRKFQALGKIYEVLSDKDRRSVYDESGEVDDDVIVQDRDWYDYWRLLFPSISVKEIQEFESNYKGSEEEKNDLKSAYVDFEGDMDRILENVMCSSVEDEERFREILTNLIKSGEIPKFKAFNKDIKSKKRARAKKASQEAAEAKDLAKELGLDKTGGPDDSLKALILQRNTSRQSAMDDMISNLEAKYCKPKSEKKKKKK